MQSGSQIILDEQYDEHYQPTEQGTVKSILHNSLWPKNLVLNVSPQFYLCDLTPQISILRFYIKGEK